MEVGDSFYYQEVKLTATRVWDKATRFRINDSKQAIWIPNSCLESGNLDWIFRKKDTQYKIKLSNQSKTY